MEINTLLLIAFLITLFVVIGLRRPVLAFCLVVAIAPWQSLVVDIGLRVTLHIISISGLISATFAMPWEKVRYTIINKIWWPLYAFLLWVIVNSFLQLPNFSEAQVVGGAMRSPNFRSWVQLFSLLFSLIPVFVAPIILSPKNDLSLVIKYFMFSIIILSLLGWVQLLSNSLFNYYPMPIGFINKFLNGVMYVGSNGVPRDLIDGNVVIYRMVSMGGEPRYLSQSIASALLIIQIYWMQSILKIEIKSIFLFLILLFTLVKTYSSSGMLLWLICGFLIIVQSKVIIVQSKVNNHSLFNIKINRVKLIGFMTLGLVALVAVISLTSKINQLYLEFVYVIRRLINRGLIADFDIPVFQFLLENKSRIWLGVGIGNIHLFAAPYLSPYFKEFAGNAAFVADSGWLRLLSENGIIGMSLFLVWLWRIFINILNLRNNEDYVKIIDILLPMFVFASVGYLLRGTTFSPVAFNILAITIVPIIAAQKKL